MTSEQNKVIVRRAFEEPWKGNLDVIDELIATQYIGHDPANPEPLRGPAGVKEFISTYRAAFPDARITVEQQLAEGDLVATRWTGRGTHEGELMGISPTGKRVTVSGLTISRLEGDKIVEEFQNWDTFGRMQQLEAVPALAQV
jgi:predicted ester cyclase